MLTRTGPPGSPGAAQCQDTAGPGPKAGLLLTHFHLGFHWIVEGTPEAGAKEAERERESECLPGLRASRPPSIDVTTSADRPHQ